MKIQENLRLMQEQLQAEQEIADRYPDTKIEVLPGSKRAWTNPAIRDDATGVMLLTDEHVMATLYLEIQGVPVLHPAYRPLQWVLEHFKETEPEAYAKLVKAFAASLQP
jgi:hypothetical protein